MSCQLVSQEEFFLIFLKISRIFKLLKNRLFQGFYRCSIFVNSRYRAIYTKLQRNLQGGGAICGWKFFK